MTTVEVHIFHKICSYMYNILGKCFNKLHWLHVVPLMQHDCVDCLTVVNGKILMEKTFAFFTDLP